MKLQIKDAGMVLVLIFFGTLLVMSLITKEDSYAFLNSAPSFECMTCHVGAEDYVVDLLLEGIPDRYEPNKTYELKLVMKSDLESISDIEGGFAAQVTAGELIDKDQIHTQLTDNFLTHTVEGNKVREWVFAWKAPADAEDQVQIEVMVVAANGDYSPSMDAVGFEIYRTNPD